MSPRLLLVAAAAALTFSLSTARIARADQGFAEPPPNAYVADGPEERPFFEPSFEARDPHASVVRLLVGPAGKVDLHAAQPGLFVATEFGRGPAGLRLSGAWLGVGNPHGVSQYASELTLDFGGRSRIHPVLGAGGGVARTSSSVDTHGVIDPKHGATLGVGVVRTGVSLRLPFDETDARIALDVTGTFPAIHGADAPKDLTPWAMGTVGVMIGF